MEAADGRSSARGSAWAIATMLGLPALLALVCLNAGFFTPPPPPAAPAGLTAQSMTPWRVKLRWNLGDPHTLLGYMLDRAPAGSDQWKTEARLNDWDTWYEDGGLDPETAYEYRLRAMGVFGTADATVRVVTPPALGQTEVDGPDKPLYQH